MGRWQTDFEVMIANANRESDRGCALILAANLDNRLRGLLENYFVEQSKGKDNDLFQGNGCLSTFSSRIAISFSSGLLGEDERCDLDIIRKIRNDFAHNECSIGFASELVSERCNSLKSYQNLREDNPDIDISKWSSRDKFQIVSVSLCLILDDRTNDALKNKRLIPKSRSILPTSPVPNG